MKPGKYLFVFFLVLVVQTGSAQKRIVLESVRFATAINYLRDAGNQKLLMTSFKELLQKYQHGVLSDTGRMNLIDLGTQTETQGQITTISPATDTSTLRLLVGIAEYTPRSYFGAFDMDSDDSVQYRKAKTVFRITIQLIGHNNELVHNNLMDVVVTRNRTRGMGNESSFVILMPRSFVEIMKTTFNLMLDPQQDMARISVAAAPVFLADNFILPKVSAQQRIMVDSAKSINLFMYQDKREMLRLAEPIYEQLLLRGRKALKYPDEIMHVVNNAPNETLSDFVFLRQEGRDVVRDKNYLVKLLVQIDPESPSIIPEMAFTNFMPGYIHLLTSGSDTIARFSISKNNQDLAKRIFPDRVFNGVDSSSMFPISQTNTSWPVTYSYVVTGKIGQQDMEIKCSGLRGAIKEIYLDDKLVCIAQGRFSPEVFVVFDASLSPELLNQLFIIGFNRFFE